jgi:hypothetical protein
VKEDAVMHGIYYKDDYDYLKHLKPIGQDPSAIYMSASNAPKQSKANVGIRFVVCVTWEGRNYASTQHQKTCLLTNNPASRTTPPVSP